MSVMDAAPYDMLKFFGANDDDDLTVVEVAGGDGGWISPAAPFFPDATLLVVLWTRGVRHIAVRHDGRVVEFPLRQIILRDGELTGVDRERQG